MEKHIIKITFDGIENTGKISDGYHTFDELYDHRVTLYIALCRAIYKNRMDAAKREALRYGTAFIEPIPFVWRSKIHSDGNPVYDGWFIMGVGKEKGEQVSYHLPLTHWDETDFAETLDRAPEWDGHTSADVLERLKSL